MSEPAAPARCADSAGAAPHNRRGLVEKRRFGLYRSLRTPRRPIILRIFGLGHCECWGFASFADGHAVFVGEVGRLDVVAVGHHRLVGHLLLGCVVLCVVPLEGEAADWEAVPEHAREELGVERSRDIRTLRKPRQPRVFEEKALII